MALMSEINTKARAEINTGFVANTSNYGGYLNNKSGVPDIGKKEDQLF